MLKIPTGTQLKKERDGSIVFPNRTILTKTFFCYKDERDTSLGKRIVETRLLIKADNAWNMATYRWNDAQTNATLELNGSDTQVSWINSNGNKISTLYHIPAENECFACHQSNSTLKPLGTKLRNLNRMVERNEISLNQINYLQLIGILNNFQVSQDSTIADYQIENYTLPERARAYLDLNCAHCHHPNGWEAATERDFDFRYETSLNQTGIKFEKEKIIDALLDREMPFIGTTLLDQEGVDLIIDYLDQL